MSCLKNIFIENLKKSILAQPMTRDLKNKLAKKNAGNIFLYI